MSVGADWCAGRRALVPLCSLDGSRDGWEREPEESRPPRVDGEKLRAVLAEVLTERQRTIVELHFFEGLSQGEVARTLGITQQVVQKALHGTVRQGRVIGGALARLRVALGPTVAP